MGIRGRRVWLADERRWTSPWEGLGAVLPKLTHPSWIRLIKEEQLTELAPSPKKARALTRNRWKRAV